MSKQMQFLKSLAQSDLAKQGDVKNYIDRLGSLILAREETQVGYMQAFRQVNNAFQDLDLETQAQIDSIAHKVYQDEN